MKSEETVSEKGVSEAAQRAAQRQVRFEVTPEFWLSLAERVVRNARPQHFRKCDRWVAVMDLTGHGSTYSQDLCRYFNLDPFEKVTR